MAVFVIVSQQLILKSLSAVITLTLDEPQVLTLLQQSCFKSKNLIGDVLALKKLTHKGGSGNNLHRYCCQDCYSPIYINVTKSGGMYLYAGTLDNIPYITF